jgi:eukaryotic-like serine/threonine-protein kinase
MRKHGPDTGNPEQRAPDEDATAKQSAFAMPPTQNIYGEILTSGAVVGSYVVDELASEGGFAAVYRAHHLHTNTPAAIKVLRQALAASPRMLERFYLEAETVRRLRHPNIVEIYELDQLSLGRPYIAMEWLDGRNLYEELALRGPFTAWEALAVMEQVGRALACAHGAGVVHRDVKDRNIMVVPTAAGFAVKLVDFGIAKLTAPDDQHQALTTRTFIGTPSTMAPEQILRQPVDERTDIYALGLVLYELVCGRLPFLSESYVAIEQMHLHTPPPRPSERARVSAAFDEVVLRALQKRQEDRYASVTELLDDLRRAVRDASMPAAGATGATGGSLGTAAGREVSCMGVAIEVKPRSSIRDRDEDELLDATEDMLERAHDFFAAQQLEVILSTASSAVAVSLPDASRDPGAHRQALIQAILAWYGACDEAVPHTIKLQVTIHEAAVTVEQHGDRVRLVAGELLQLHRWPQRPDLAGVLATRAALANAHLITPGRQESGTIELGKQIDVYPLAGSDDFYRVEDTTHVTVAPTMLS